MAKKTWCVPELTDEFRERMEDVLDQYQKPLDPAEPVICLDEQPYQMVDDARPPEQAQPGKIAKQDYEYRRCGTCSVFVAVEPKAGKRLVRVKRHRKRPDFARFVRDLAVSGRAVWDRRSDVVRASLRLTGAAAGRIRMTYPTRRVAPVSITGVVDGRSIDLEVPGPPWAT